MTNFVRFEANGRGVRAVGRRSVGSAEPRPAALTDRVPSPADRRLQRRWIPATASFVALLIGIADVVRGTLGSDFRGLHRIAPPGVLANLAPTADVLIGLLLVMLSHGLRRRKRRAWSAAVLVLGVGVVLHAALPPERQRLPDLLVEAALLVLLISSRGEFYALGDRSSRWRSLWIVGALVGADLVIGLSFLAASAFVGGYGPIVRLESVICNVAGFSGPVQFVFRSEVRADLYAFLTSGLGLFTAVAAGYLFLRPAQRPGKLSADDADRIRDLLDRHGAQDSLGYFALRADKNVIWSPSGKSCIGYRVVSGVMLAAGDPIGDPEAWPGAIRAFLGEASRHAWVPAVIGCSELGAQVWCRQGGLTALELGDEAIVSVAEFCLDGRRMRNVRQMAARASRHGYQADVRRVSEIGRDEVGRLVRQADSWRGNPTERGFSMALGRVGAEGDERCVIASATRDGAVQALLHFVPWGSDGLSLDLMRRDRSAVPGLNDYLIVETIKHAAELGVKRISLNFAVFRGALERGERIGAGPVLRSWRAVLLFLSRWFQIESLYRFNAKFCPQWVPRFVVFPGTREVLRIGLACLEAEAFLVWPRLRMLAPRPLASGTLARRLGLGRPR